MAALSEDDIYRGSTQYRLWGFTPASLASLRGTTNALAADGVRAAIASRRQQSAEAQNSHGGDASTGDSAAEVEVDCLNLEEEQKLVGFYCVKAMQLADFCDFPTNVKATAVQYLKRFYLSNSPMTYHPKEIMLAAVFLSTKTENHYTSLRNFASKLPKATEEDVIAPEFLLTQGLRFAFDVRHPQRGLEGGFMELMALARGHQGQLVKNKMMDLGPSKSFNKRTRSTDALVQRIQHAHGIAKETLKTSALLTDVYFHYTSSQIWMAAYLHADEPLTMFYLSVKLSTMPHLESKLVATLKSCRTMLESSPSADPGDSEKKELVKIDKKLYKCRNPEKMDLVGMNKAQKRDGDGQSGNGLDEKTLKKRKLERRQAEKDADDVFGPSIGAQKPG